MSESYRYTVRFLNPLTHYAEIEGVFPTTGGSLELFMAVWTPGSYLVREYSRHVEDVAAFDPAGGNLTIRKTRKNRWQIYSESATEVRVTYRLYCHELSVRTNWVDEQFALLHGAATYLSVVGQLDRPHLVSVILPAEWQQSVAGLPRVASNTYLAPDYDTLVDSPILIGNPAIHEFEAAGKRHYLVNSIDDAMWDAARAVEDTSKIIAKNLDMWGSLPYDAYWFLNILVEDKGGGGLEHKNSCALIASRYATRTRSNYVRWLELLSHEFFHVWNVKRLRPIELGPFDYENENYTRALWMAEGFTEHYGTLMAARAGVITCDEYLSALSGEIEKLQTTPGRFTRSAELSSFDAWIKLYRPDDNSINASISYYTKGAVIAFLLDARLRATGHTTLDDVMRLAYGRYSGAVGFPEGTIQEITGPAFTDSTEELDYSIALEQFGLRFKTVANGGSKAWLGCTTKTDNGRLMIATVPRETPAFEAGLSASDEILAVSGSRVLPDEWSTYMEHYRPGESVTILVSRRGRIINVEAMLAQDPGKRWTLEINPEATSAQRRQFNAWLGQPQQP
jgi:predicted metalloprotease with PDZ domain